VVRDVRTKGTGVSRMAPYWTDSSLVSTRLPPQGTKRQVLHRFGHPRCAGPTPQLRASSCRLRLP